MHVDIKNFDRGEKPSFLIPRLYDPRDWEDVILDQELYTCRDYQNLPEGAPYQLIGGKLVMTPVPEILHQRVSGNLNFKLRSFVLEQGLGEVFYAPIDAQFSEYNVFQPDIIFISNERMEIIGKKRIEGSPDLIMEILSPSTAYFDLREKFDIYELYGVKEYWIVDYNRQEIETYFTQGNRFHLMERAKESGTISSVLLQGFRIKLEDIFIVR